MSNVSIKTLKEVEGIRVASQMAAETLMGVGRMIRAGITTEDINTFVHQDTVERAKRSLIPGDVTASAKPRSATEAAVLESLEPGEQYSAAEVAGRVGVSRATAQRYLSSLADDGAVYIQLRYGTTGRPEHRYGLPAG